MDNTTLADELEAWTLWSEQRPSDHTLNYRWRVPARKILGMELRPEWTEKMHLCGMGYGDNEWWPPFSHWDGYNRTVPKGTEWRIATEDETDVYWGGLHMEPSPFSGMPPKIEYHGRFIGAPPYQPEWLKIVSPMIGFNTWTDAAKMQAAWNTRTPAPAPVAVGGEPVAWMYTDKFGCQRVWLIRQSLGYVQAEIETPLYAALQAQPTASTAQPDDVVERVKAAIMLESDRWHCFTGGEGIDDVITRDDDGGEPQEMARHPQGDGYMHFWDMRGEAIARAALAAMQQQECHAVLRYDRTTPGNENEMPKVLSCNWLPDGEYQVFLRPQQAPVADDVRELVEKLLACRNKNVFLYDKDEYAQYPLAIQAAEMLTRLTQPQPDAAVAVEQWQHVAYFDEGQFHWMSGIAPRDCELYARPIRAGGQPS